MIIIIAEPGKKVHLGRIGENEARAVQFDISQTQAEFPGASFSVLNMRPQDPDAYPVNGQFIRIEGSNLYWTLQSGDLTEDGLGECELKATVDGVIVKSEIWTTEICPALDGNGTPPEPWESWQQQVEDDADRAEAAAELLEHPGAEAETLPAGSQATASYADGVFTFGIPKGDTGEDGYSPTVRMMRGSGRLNIYITDKNGTKSSYVDDGKDGRKLAMGSVSTLETGEPATAEIIDNPQWPEMYLNLGLPKGNTGDQGEQGETGETPIISIGTVTTLPAGSSATASMDTTDPEHPVLSMGIPKGDPGEVTEAELEKATTELKSQIDGKASIIRDTVSNVAIASVPDGAANLPLTALRFAVEPIQAGTGDPSPQNQRAITGRTSAVVSACAVNLFDKTINCTEGKLRDDDGTESVSTNTKYTDPIGGFLPNTKYTIQGTLRQTGSQYRIYYLDRDKNWISRSSGRSETPYTFTTPANCYYIEIQCRMTGTDFDTVMVEKGETASSYTAYTGTTHTVQFGSTVYGCLVDYVHNKGYITHAIKDMGDLYWTKTTATPPSFGTDSITDRARGVCFICSCYKTASSTGQSDVQNLEIGGNLNSVTVYVRDSNYEDAAAFKTAVTGQKICYELATPIEIPLSDLDEISTLNGENNIWADSGDIVELTYPCDTKGYIDKKLAELTALVLET